MRSTEGPAVKAQASESSFQRPDSVLAGPSGQAGKLSRILGAAGNLQLEEEEARPGRQALAPGRSLR